MELQNDQMDRHSSSNGGYDGWCEADGYNSAPMDGVYSRPNSRPPTRMNSEKARSLNSNQNRPPSRVGSDHGSAIWSGLNLTTWTDADQPKKPPTVESVYSDVQR